MLFHLQSPRAAAVSRPAANAVLCNAMRRTLCYALLCIAMHCYALLRIAMHCYALICIALSLLRILDLTASLFITYFPALVPEVVLDCLQRLE